MVAVCLTPGASLAIASVSWVNASEMTTSSPAIGHFECCGTDMTVSVVVNVADAAAQPASMATLQHVEQNATDRNIGSGPPSSLFIGPGDQVDRARTYAAPAPNAIGRGLLC